MRKLLIVVGAGASLDFGMPSVKDIDKLFEEWSLDILPLRDEPSKSLYSWVKEKLFNYVSQDKSNRLDNIINFENILFLIQNLYSLSKDRTNERHNTSLNSFIDVSEFPVVISFEKEKEADCHDFHFLQSRLIDKLLDYFRTKCRTIKTDKLNELESLKLFFESLKEDFKIGFINLNYDNILTRFYQI